MFRYLLLQIGMLFVMFVRPTQGVETFRNIASPFCTLAIFWPPCKILLRSSQGNPSTGGIKCNRGSQIERWWTYWRLYLINDTRHGLGFGYYYRLIGNHIHRIHWYHIGPPRVTINRVSGPHFRSAATWPFILATAVRRAAIGYSSVSY